MKTDPAWNGGAARPIRFALSASQHYTFARRSSRMEIFACPVKEPEKKFFITASMRDALRRKM